MLIRNDMDVNEDERLSNITFKHKLKSKNSCSTFQSHGYVFCFIHM